MNKKLIPIIVGVYTAATVYNTAHAAKTVVTEFKKISNATKKNKEMLKDVEHI